MLLCDFHIHSRHSDGHHSIPELIDHYGKRGFDCIAITDHLCEESSLLGRGARFLGRTLTRNSFPAYLEEIDRESRRAWNRYSMLVLPGVEITKNHFSNARSAHYLGVGIRDWVNPDKSLIDGLRELKAQGVLTVAAHPLGTDDFEAQTLQLWQQRSELAPWFDAWEAGSGKKTFPAVLQSGLPYIANSDLHHLKQFESWKTLVDAEKDRADIFDAIRNQRIRPWFYREQEDPPCLAVRIRGKRFHEASLGA